MAPTYIGKTTLYLRILLGVLCWGTLHPSAIAQYCPPCENPELVRSQKIRSVSYVFHKVPEKSEFDRFEAMYYAFSKKGKVLGTYRSDLRSWRPNSAGQSYRYHPDGRVAERWDLDLSRFATRDTFPTPGTDLGRYQRWAYVYNAQGQLHRENKIAADLKTVLAAVEYTYDEAGRKTGEYHLQYPQADTLQPSRTDTSSYTLFEYDAEGRLQKMAYHVQHSTTRYELDSLGQITYSAISKAGAPGLDNRFENEYNDQGQLLRSTMESNLGFTEIREFTYNQAGQLQRQTLLNPEGEAVHYFECHYEYYD